MGGPDTSGAVGDNWILGLQPGRLKQPRELFRAFQSAGFFKHVIERNQNRPGKVPAPGFPVLCRPGEL